MLSLVLQPSLVFFNEFSRVRGELSLNEVLEVMLIWKFFESATSASATQNGLFQQLTHRNLCVLSGQSLPWILFAHEPIHCLDEWLPGLFEILEGLLDCLALLMQSRRSELRQNRPEDSLL